MTSESGFDYVAALARADAEVVAIIGEDFLGLAPADLEQMQKAAVTADCETLGRLAHTYKGLAGNFGAQPLVSAAAALQAACRSGSCDAGLLSAVERELNALCEALREKLRRGAA